jgi:hypothetical protein
MMKRNLLFLSLFVLLSAGVIYGQPATGQAKANAYDEVLAKLTGGDTSIDFKALRFAFAEKVGTNPVDMKSETDMVKALNDKNFKEAAKISESIQKMAYVDMNSHVIAAMAYKGLGDMKKSKFHEAVYIGLVNSILNGGDGNSTKTAYEVISVAEEYVLLNALELKRGTQAVLEENGHKYDVLTVTDKATNETQKVYFNIDRVWKGYEKVPK